MRKQYLLLVIVMALACLLTSCDLFPKGGTIEVTNEAEGVLGSGNLVIIVKGLEFAQALDDLKNGDGTQIAKGATEEFHYDDIGVYTVVALFPTGFTKTVTLTLGSTEKVTIK